MILSDKDMNILFEYIYMYFSDYTSDTIIKDLLNRYNEDNGTGYVEITQISKADLLRYLENYANYDISDEKYTSILNFLKKYTTSNKVLTSNNITSLKNIDNIKSFINNIELKYILDRVFGLDESIEIQKEIEKINKNIFDLVNYKTEISESQTPKEDNDVEYINGISKYPVLNSIPFFEKYAIKDGELQNEESLNLYGKQLKKELNDVYNRLQVLFGLKALEYSKLEFYKVGEIVNFKNKNYICIKDAHNEDPTNTSKWQEIDFNGISTFNRGNFLAKDNEYFYDPLHLESYENTNRFHPTTVGFVHEHAKKLITTWVANGNLRRAKQLKNEDLNTVLVGGYYYQNDSTADLKSLNYPSNVRGYLTVFSSAISDDLNMYDYVTQSYKALEEHNEWRRTIKVLRTTGDVVTVSPWSAGLSDDMIVDNLNSTNKKLALSANQGRVIRLMIEQINNILQSDDVSLDELQEIINYIKANRDLINNLGIDSIIGLRNYTNQIDNLSNNYLTLDRWNSTEFRTRMLALDGAGSGLDAEYLGGIKYDKYALKTDLVNTNILNLIKQVDGAGSGLDADTLDGLNSTAFLRRDKSDTPTTDDTYNLGSSSLKWANIYATNFQGTALKAKYADLAENYDLGFNVKPGDVIGINEYGFKLFEQGDKLIGVVSDNPAVLINSDSTGTPIALKGLVEVKINGDAKLGQYIIADKNGRGIAVDNLTFDTSLLKLGVVVKIDKNKVFIKV